MILLYTSLFYTTNFKKKVTYKPLKFDEKLVQFTTIALKSIARARLCKVSIAFFYLLREKCALRWLFSTCSLRMENGS